VAKLELPKTLFLPLGDLLFQKHKDSQIKIKDYFTLKCGKTPFTKNLEYYENGTIKWINSGVLTNSFVLTDDTEPSKLITEKAVQEKKLKFTKKKTVLFSLIGLNITWCWSDNFVYTHSIISFENEKELNCATLFFALRQVNLKKHASGCVFQALTKSGLSNMKIDWVANPKKQKIFLTLLSYNKKV